jgi:hypothetical protein
MTTIHVSGQPRAPAKMRLASPQSPLGWQVATLCLLTAGLILVLTLPASIWFGGLPVLLLVFALGWGNARHFPAGALCWPNVFLLFLTLFHLGYYVVVYYGLTTFRAALGRPLTDAYVTHGLKLFVVSCLALEVGAVFGLGSSSVRPHAPRTDQMRERRSFFNLGLATTGLSLVFLGVFIVQFGGLAAVARLDYAHYVDFLQSRQPTYLTLAIEYLPVGLLLLYTFMDRTAPDARRTALFILVPFFLFTLWLLWIGNRNSALLAWVALAYIYNVRVRRVALRNIVVVALAILLVVGPVHQLRNLAPGNRTAAIHTLSFNPLSGIAELGFTLRPYAGFVEQRDQGKTLGLRPYRFAVDHILPGHNGESGPVLGGNDRPRYYRSTVWITYLLNPIDAELGIGAGGSAIGEPYLAMGVAGVILVFAAIGWFIAYLEKKAVRDGSAAALATIAFVFSAISFYVRDDAYGLLRPVAWGVIAVLGIQLFLVYSRASRRAETLEAVGSG